MKGFVSNEIIFEDFKVHTTLVFLSKAGKKETKKRSQDENIFWGYEKLSTNF
jgi:hypothetical protein